MCFLTGAGEVDANPGRMSQTDGVGGSSEAYGRRIAETRDSDMVYFIVVF